MNAILHVRCRRLARWILLGSMALVLSSGQAKATWTLLIPSYPAGIPGKTPPPLPNYFSGTDNQISAQAYTQDSTDPGLIRFQMQLNGITVRDYTFSSPGVMNEWDYVTFDSTYFADGSSVAVTLNIWLTSGETDSLTASVPVYNKAYVLGSQGTQMGSAVQSSVWNIIPAGMRGDGSTSYLKLRILNDLPIYTVFFDYTHGANDNFSDCLAPDNLNESYNLYAFTDPTGAASIADMINSKSPDQPPYSFVFLSSCESAAASTLASAYGITSSSTDQAFLGYTDCAPDNEAVEDWISRYWTNLMAGQTVTQAAQNADSVFKAVNWSIIGDGSTTIHGTVYGGPTGQWYR